ncbi:MAG: T9SS type A sorting domain-containing protein [Candidatus Stahlbacteria bacterium]|nr:T9SS type A sorting domain-containing protein [Candidatus Stahlbacteria bacterium]
MRKLRIKGLIVLMVGLMGIWVNVWGTEWYIATVDTTMYSGMSGISIALDSLGNPHIAYCRPYGNGLIYASLNPDSTWSYEVVFDSIKKEEKGRGSKPSLVLDSKGYPHITFWELTLGYVWKDSSGWHYSRPDSVNWVECSALALDKDDSSHIAYVVNISDTVGVIVYRKWNGVKWRYEIVDTAGKSGMGAISIVIDSANTPCISFGSWYTTSGYDNYPGIEYAVRDTNGVWHIEIVDSSDTSFFASAGTYLAINSLNQPCISYFSAHRHTGIPQLRYAQKTDTGWIVEVVDTTWSGYGNAVCIDSNDNPHIVYRKGEDPELVAYAGRKDNKWWVDVVDTVRPDTITPIGTYCGIAIDTTGYVHLSYYSEIHNFTVKCAKGNPEYGVESDMERQLDAGLNVYSTIGQKSIRIEYILNKECDVNLSIYDIAGRKIVELTRGKKVVGKHIDYWEIGNTNSNGVYFCRLYLENKGILSKKFIIMR